MAAEPGGGPPRLAWRRIVLWALLGTALATGLTLADLGRTEETNGWLIGVGPDHPSVALVAADFDDLVVSERGSHDGAQLYAIARTIPDLDAAARSLDRPRYRLQRPLFPMLARMLAPAATGRTLVWVMFALGVAALLGGGIAAGSLSTTLRGPAWVAAMLPVLPGSLVSLRITVADVLAVALVLGAACLSLRGRPWLAVALGSGAVLTKEAMVVTLAGLLCWRRDRDRILLVAVPGAIAGAWGAYLLWRFREVGAGVEELTLPFTGIVDSIRDVWVPGSDLFALLCFVVAVLLTVFVLARCRPTHPLYFAVVLNAAFLACTTISVVGLDRNGPRAVLPLMILAIVALAAPASPLGDPAGPRDARARSGTAEAGTSPTLAP